MVVLHGNSDLKGRLMFLRCLFAAIMLSVSPAGAQTLLYKNPCPAPSQSDPTYLAGVQAIRDAIDAGKTITMSMSYAEGGGTSKFWVQFSAIKATSNYVSGLLLLRPPLNNDAQAVAGTYSVGGSADSLGRYTYAPMTGGAVTTGYCYENAWWSH